MTELENEEASGAKRLVLGFDGGCMTCSELARRIEERVSDKLEVRSLRDPQVQEWRKRALGEDAPWTPTLIEAEGTKVRAWTGRRMAVYMSRFLGPVATWRVLQALGELRATQEVEESPAARVVAGFTRGQFLKSTGGAAVAMYFLSSAAALAPTALADGLTAERASRRRRVTPSQRKKASAIIRDSKQYENLEKEQKRETDNPAATFDFDKDSIKVRDNYAAVGVASAYGKYGDRGVGAVFYVDLDREKSLAYTDYVVTPKGENEYDAKLRVEGKVEERVTLGDKYVITADGRKISYRQYEKELKRRAQESRFAAQQTAEDCFSDCFFPCLPQEKHDCEVSLIVAGAVGGLAVPGRLATIAGGLFGLGALVSGFCENSSRVACSDICDSECNG